jgi:hypothetical protein
MIEATIPMFYGNTPQDTRPVFFASWQKYQRQEILSALEQQLVRVILDHPGYQAMFARGSHINVQRTPSMGATVDTQGVGYENPFLHMGLHLAVRDQVSLDKPTGMTALYQILLTRHQDAHDVEHLLMEQLAHCLWEAQKRQGMPDEQAYLVACKELLR